MRISQRFWAWYERHYHLNVTLATLLFALQLMHLYWLTTDVVASRLSGISYFNPTPLLEYLLIVADYTEIPAILGTSLIYLDDLRHGRRGRNLFYLFALNVQWLHIFWITDEFVIGAFREGTDTILPGWLAWIALLIDYLELPVIVDTLRRVVLTFRAEGWHGLFRAVAKKR